MNLGRIKFRVTRVQGYFTVVATCVNLWAAFTIIGISHWWSLLAIPVLYVIHKVDKYRIHPHEAATMFQDNLEWQELTRQVKEIHDSLLRPQDGESSGTEQQTQAETVPEVYRWGFALNDLRYGTGELYFSQAWNKIQYRYRPEPDSRLEWEV